MKTAILSLLTLNLALTAGAATIIPIRLSDEPVASVVSTNDDVIINATNSGTGTWTTKRATVQKLINAATPQFTSIAQGVISLSGITLTNFRVGPSAGAVQSYTLYTNQLSAGWPSTNQWSATNSVYLIHAAGFTNPAGDGQWSRYVERWTSPSGAYFENLWHPYHDNFTAGGAEMQTTSSGGWAWSANYNNSTYANYNSCRRAWQWGIGGWGAPYIYHQASLIPLAANTNLSEAMFPRFFVARVWTNATGSMWAGSRNTTTKNPAEVFSAIDTNGNGALTFYDDLDNQVDANGNWANLATAFKRLRIIFGPNGGLSFNGTLTNNGVAGLSTNIDLGNGLTQIFTNGILVGVVPTPVFWDTDATNYTARISTANTTALATNLNTCFKALKADNTYSNVMGLYLFPGSNSSTNGLNLVGTSYTITWSGGVTNSATGVQGNGVDGYGDTGWKPTSTNAWLFVWIKTGMITNSYRCVAHVRDASNSRFGFANNTSQNWVYYANDNAGQSGTYPTYPSSIYMVRSSITSRKFYQGGSMTPFPDDTDTPTTPPNYNMYVLARNSSGSPDSFYDGKIQALAFGTNALSASQYKTLHDAVSAFNTAQGR